MNAQYLVSVIIPAYNHEKYIGEAIESVLNQTYKNWELIIIDDGSVDNTSEKIEPYLKDQRIFFYRQKNKGVVATLNRGISLAKGELICFLDSDDKFGSKKLENQVNVILEGADIVPTKIIEINAEGRKVATSSLVDYFNLLPFDIDNQVEIKAKFEQANFFCKSSVLLKKSIIDKLGGFNDKLSCVYDYDFWLRALNENFKVKWDLNEDTCYRVHSKNETKKNKGKLMLESVAVIFNNFIHNKSRKTLDIWDDILKEKVFNLITLKKEKTGETDIFKLINDKNLLADVENVIDESEKKKREISELYNLYTEIEKRDTEITNRGAEIARRDTEIAKRDAEIIKKNKLVIELYDVVAEKDDSIKQLVNKTELLKGEIEKKDTDLKEVNKAMGNLQNELNFIKGSKFWRARERYCKFKKLIIEWIVPSRKKISSTIKKTKKQRVVDEKSVKKIINRGEIAMVCSTGLIGGAEKVFEQHVKFLAQHFSVDVFFQYQGGPIFDFLKPFAKNLFVGEKECAEKNLAKYKYIYLVQVLPDISKIKKFNPKTKVSFIVHDPILWINELKKVSENVKYIDHFFSISKLIQNKLLKAFPEISPEKSSVLYNSFCFAPKRENEAKKTLENKKINSKKFVWGYAGRFSFEKNTLGVVKMFSEFAKKHSEHKLILAGDVSIKDNPDLIEYKEKILKVIEKTPQIEYWGYQSNLKKFYKNIDGLVMASFIEGISVAALDSLAYGIPVLTTNVGSMGEIIKNGFNGTLVNLESIRENPFDNKKIKFTEIEELKFKQAMNSFCKIEWDRKEIIKKTYRQFSKEVISKEFTDKINNLIF